MKRIGRGFGALLVVRGQRRVQTVAQPQQPRRPFDRAAGFTIVEAVIGCVVFGIIAAVMLNSFIALRSSYTTARQLNEIYTVLSACPEVDRALEFSSLTSSSNCYPNNSFPAEDGGTGTITYSPTLTVSDTASLPNTDPLQTIPDSKVVQIDVGFPRPNTAVPHLKLRMLITRNGVGQL